MDRSRHRARLWLAIVSLFVGLSSSGCVSMWGVGLGLFTDTEGGVGGQLVGRVALGIGERDDTSVLMTLGGGGGLDAALEAGTVAVEGGVDAVGFDDDLSLGWRMGGALSYGAVFTEDVDLHLSIGARAALLMVLRHEASPGIPPEEMGKVFDPNSYELDALAIEAGAAFVPLTNTEWAPKGLFTWTVFIEHYSYLPVFKSSEQ